MAARASDLIFLLALATTAVLVVADLARRRSAGQTMDRAFWGVIAMLLTLPERLHVPRVVQLILLAIVAARLLWTLARRRTKGAQD